MANPNTIPYLRYQEIQTSDVSVTNSFKQAWDTSNYTTALNILVNNVQQLTGKTLNANAVAKIANGLVTLQAKYDTATRQFLAAGLDHEQLLLDSIQNLQEYDETADYVLFNFVLYDDEIYMALDDVPVGTLPTDEDYWLYVGLKGEQGAGAIQGAVKYNWSSTTNYVQNDIVVYNNIVYIALQNSRGRTPSTSSTYWGVIYKPNKQGLEVVDELPEAPMKGTIWFLKSKEPVYGVMWDGTSSTKWTRTNLSTNFTDPVPYVSGMSASECSSPFDNIMPWAGMQIVEDEEAGTLVSIPKFYYKLKKHSNDDGMSIQISNEPLYGFICSPAHINRGDGKGERDVVYVGRYHCAEGTLKSEKNVMPQASKTRSAFRTDIHNLGDNIYQMDFAMRFTIWLLYIVEFANWDSQTKIGGGCSPNTAKGTMGQTDDMPYHTGTTASSRGTAGNPVYGWTQYRNIEGLWDNVYDWLDGCYNDSNGLNIILNPANFSDTTGGTAVSVPIAGYPSAFTVGASGGFPMFYSTQPWGDESTYSCDWWGCEAEYPCVCAGGSYGQDVIHGLFCLFSNRTSGAYVTVGSRLMKL